MALIEQHRSTSIHVFSRDPSKNLLPNMKYHAGSLTSAADVDSLLSSVRPDVGVHVASPPAVGNDISNKMFFEANVNGTKRLLAASQAHGVRAFVYTSSASVTQPPYSSATETQPLIVDPSGTNNYSYTKALADVAVRAENRRSKMLTACLRVTSVYGAA